MLVASPVPHCGQCLRQDRGIGRIGLELLAQDVAHLAARAGDEHEAADSLRLLRRDQRDERALAVTDEPGTGRRRALLRLKAPCAHVGCIVAHAHVVSVHGRRAAAEHAAPPPDEDVVQEMLRTAISVSRATLGLEPQAEVPPPIVEPVVEPELPAAVPEPMLTPLSWKVMLALPFASAFSAGMSPA